MAKATTIDATTNPATMMGSRANKIKSFLSAAVMIIIAAACNIDSERSAYCNLGPEGWAYADTLSLPISEADTAGLSDTPVNVAVAIRHAADYEYSNIWLEVRYHDLDTLRTDTVDIRLADEFGRWRGHGVGVGYQHVDTVLRNVRLNFSTPISIRHIMRADTLAGIEQAGIIISFDQ